MKDWKLEDAKATGARILTGTWVDPAHKEKSRYCAREFNTHKDPTVFAAASARIEGGQLGDTPDFQWSSFAFSGGYQWFVNGFSMGFSSCD